MGNEDFTQFDAVPSELKERPQWVCWRIEPRANGEKPTKIPHVAGTTIRASSTDSHSWRPYDFAVRAYRADSFHEGIGFVFGVDDDFGGVDLDDCVGADGQIAAWAQKEIDLFNSYTEFSPSGNGIKIFIRCNPLPATVADGGDGRRRTGNYEMYTENRYFTTTGRHLTGTPLKCEWRDDQMRDLYQRLFTVKKPAPVPKRTKSIAATGSREPTDGDIIEKVTDNTAYARLWSGDISAYGSASEADLAMVGRIAFFVGNNPTRISSIFEQSSMTREKWSRDDYRAATIKRALSGKTEFFGWFGRVNKLLKGKPESSNNGSDRVFTAERAVFEHSIPLDQRLSPSMPNNIFRGWLGDHINAVTAATETPIEMSAMMGLAAIATTVQRRFSVEVEPGYFEPLNVYIATVMDSGSRKTAVINNIFRPLLDWEKAKLSEMSEKIKRAKSDRQSLTLRIKELQKKASKENDAAKQSQFMDEAATLEATLPEVPKAPRLFVQDVTTEHLATILAENGERISMVSDEGGVFDLMAGRYSGGIPNIDLYLQAHAGAFVRVDRGSKPPAILNHPALTMGLSIQQKVLSAMGKGDSGKAKSIFRGRGLLARFMYVIPRSNLGYRTHLTTPIPDGVKRNYTEAMSRLAAVEPRIHEDAEVPRALRFSPNATAAWKNFQREIEPMLKNDGRLEHLSDWGSKLPGAVARVAGLLHCADYASQIESARDVESEVVERAIQLGRYLIGHALIAFDLMGDDQGYEAARALWRNIEKNRKDAFTAREAWMPLRTGRFKRIADVEPGFDVLVEHNYISELIEGDVRHGKPGRPSRKFVVNPDLMGEWY